MNSSDLSWWLVAGSRRLSAKELVMALLDRVATLVRANLNDLVDRAENPEKMLKQVILDMENQFLQVKTQVAIALADLHLLEKKKKENADKQAEWMRKAELAVDKKDDELARAALERALSYQQLSQSFEEQIADQQVQVESLKGALKRLEMKLNEARGKVDLLIAQHRRSRSVSKAADAENAPTGEGRTFERMKSKVAREQAIGKAKSELLGEDIEARLHKLERDEKIEGLLQQLKERKQLSA
jgi:phage shock protein A